MGTMDQLSYEDAVAYLTERPNEILDAWNWPADHVAGRLFAWTGMSGTDPTGVCGCLTQVRGGLGRAANDDLTLAIYEDERIPEIEDDITVESLPVFREWQERLDEVLPSRWGHGLRLVDPGSQEIA